MAESTPKLNKQWYPEGRYNILHELARRVVEYAQVKPREHVLDIACGPAGTCTEYLLARESDLDIWAVDKSQGALDSLAAYLGRKYPGALGRQVHLDCADVCHLPFEDGCFDVITGVGAMSNFAEPRQALVELRRVIKEDGRFVIGENFLPSRILELWQILYLPKYGALKPFIDYHELMFYLANVRFGVEVYEPLLWYRSADQVISEKEHPVLRNAMVQSLLNAPDQLKSALDLKERNGKMSYAYNCCVLRVRPVDEVPAVWD